MIIQLIDNNQPLVDEWNKLFKDCSDVKTYCDNFFKIPTNCFVSPANSYGFLNGGIDNQIRMFYEEAGEDIQNRVQDSIQNNGGELLVGQSIYLPMYKSKAPDLIVAPTMRVPMKLPKDTINVYLSMRTILLNLKHIKEYNSERVQSISISGLGTGIGKVPFDICAKQMKQAYDDIWLGKYKFPKTWGEAQERHQLLYGDEVRDIQYEELNLKGNKLWDKD